MREHFSFPLHLPSFRRHRRMPTITQKKLSLSPDDESERLERFAIDALDTIWNAFIHEFDCHDAINTIADFYEVERSDLLEYYDNKF